MKKFSPPLALLLGAALLPFLIASCASIRFFPSSSYDGLTLEKYNHDGFKRTYYLHLPSIPASGKKCPVLFVLHGGGVADGDDVAFKTGYNELADRDGFIAVYPNGINAQWNDGRGKTFRLAKDNSQVDDVGFISGLIDLIIGDYNGDPSRIYITGLSNGGMMTLRLGCEIGDKLAAIAPIIASMPLPLVERTYRDSPLPILLMNGTEDPLVPWEGGWVRLVLPKRGEVLSTEETVSYWVERNRSSPLPEVKALPDLDAGDNSRVVVFTYTHEEDGADVILYKIEGGGHYFPGSNNPEKALLLGRKNQDIDGPEIVWAFLREYSK